MSRILVPDLVTTNFDKLSFQRDVDVLTYKTIEDYTKERDNFSDAEKRSMVPFNSKDSEDFPNRHVLTGIQEHGPFSRAFFSKENLAWLHRNIRYKVYTLSDDNSVISKQKDEQVLEAMRRLFLQNSNNPVDGPGIKKELLRLNNIVLNDTVPRIISELYQYRKYLSDIENVATPNLLPINSSVTGTKLNRSAADVMGIFV
jgi:hypothetical protein